MKTSRKATGARGSQTPKQPAPQPRPPRILTRFDGVGVQRLQVCIFDVTNTGVTMLALVTPHGHLPIYPHEARDLAGVLVAAADAADRLGQEGMSQC